MVGGDALQRAARRGQRSGRQREPRDEAEALGLARLEHRFGGAGGEVVHVLHRHDRGDLLRGLQLLDVDLGQADVADLALLLQRGQLTDLVLERGTS